MRVFAIGSEQPGGHLLPDQRTADPTAITTYRIIVFNQPPTPKLTCGLSTQPKVAARRGNEIFLFFFQMKNNAKLDRLQRS